jgi:exocyst complex component 4
MLVARKENVSKFVHNLDISTPAAPNKGKTPLFHALIVDLILEDKIVPTATAHPESDSFTYIKTIILALRSLSQVHRAMDTLSQRLPVEVYQLVDKTISEVEARHSINMHARSGGRAREVRVFASGDGSEEVLRDLLWTLFSKLSAVLSGHRIVHDCVLGLVKESKGSEDLRDTPEYIYLEVWKPIQSEVQPKSPIGFEES